MDIFGSAALVLKATDENIKHVTRYKHPIWDRAMASGEVGGFFSGSSVEMMGGGARIVAKRES